MHCRDWETDSQWHHERRRVKGDSAGKVIPSGCAVREVSHEDSLTEE